MNSVHPEDPDNTKQAQHQRRLRRRLRASEITACMGLTSFLSVAGHPRFETIHTLDVIRLMTAGAAIAVTLLLLSPGPR